MTEITIGTVLIGRRLNLVVEHGALLTLHKSLLILGDGGLIAPQNNLLNLREVGAHQNLHKSLLILEDGLLHLRFLTILLVLRVAGLKEQELALKRHLEEAEIILSPLLREAVAGVILAKPFEII